VKSVTSTLASLQEVATSSDPILQTLGEVGAGGFVRAALVLLFGIPLVLGLSAWLRRRVSTWVDQQVGLVAGKLLLYPGLLLLVVLTMSELGFSLGPLLGAAGILGIAIGFASQTSVSNVISGLFLIAERPFVVDDLITVGDVTGRVISIDTISVKLRTFDNRLVRIPNETLIKSQVINVTRFPIRRLDVRVGVAYKENAARVREILREVATDNPLCLMEPEPLVLFEGFGESSIDFLFGVWSTQENYLRLRNSIQEEVKARLDEEGIEIPFPHRTLYMGSESDPLPVRLTDPAPGGGTERGHEPGGSDGWQDGSGAG
jgi:small-conductance mechanosensitive channel